MERLTERTEEGRAIPRMELRHNGHQRCMDRLAEYEDLEEQGRLPKLPCNIGDFVFAINKNKFIELHRIVSIEIADDGIYCKSDCRFCRIDDFGKTVFFTKEEAREALEKREVEGNDGE